MQHGNYGIAVISGEGVKGYYESRGYYEKDTFMIKDFTIWKVWLFYVINYIFENFLKYLLKYNNILII